MFHSIKLILVLVMDIGLIVRLDFGKLNVMQKELLMSLIVF